MEAVWVLSLLMLAISTCVVESLYEDITRIKADNEPNMVSHSILQGVIEPFELSKRAEIPAWKQMKDAADHKAAKLYLSQALSSYNQLLRHPYMFGDMPLEERYDVFVSMAKILKRMGFQQRAELLLYEAMGYTTTPHEAHYQLALLGLDKEELNEAKMHFKNCLFHKPEDVLILTHLTMVLIAEGKIYEAKFYLSQLLSALETRTRQWLRESGRDVSELVHLTARVDQSDLARWLEEMMVRVMHGELQVTHSTTLQLFRTLSSLYTLLGDGVLTGRLVFDIGQSLYEGGRPSIGHMMMVRGHNTSNPALEGLVSFEVVKMRLRLDYPVVPTSIREVVERYLNITLFLSDTGWGIDGGSNSDEGYSKIDTENILDIYWPVPLLGWAGLPTAPMHRELLWRFQDSPVRSDPWGKHFLSMKVEEEGVSLHDMYEREEEREEGGSYPPSKYPLAAAMLRAHYTDHDTLGDLDREEEEEEEEEEDNEEGYMMQQERARLGDDYSDSIKVLHSDLGTQRGEASLTSRDVRRANKFVKDTPKGAHRKDSQHNVPVRIEVGILSGHINAHPVGQTILSRILGYLAGRHSVDVAQFRVTLLALVVRSDHITKKIASNVHEIVNLPLNKARAWAVVQALHLDIVLLPDWAPWPDSQVLLFANSRIAPIQACFHVRGAGSGCHGSAIDYYLLPRELELSYTGESSRDATARPGWLESRSEQVVFLDWPLLPATTIQELASLAASAPLSGQHHHQNGSAMGDSPGQGSNPVAGSMATGPSGVTSTSTYQGITGSSSPSTSLGFVPLEVEGQIFFEDQPSAILPCHPSQMHPLMDATIFKLMHAAPSLHLVLVLPRIYFASEASTSAEAGAGSGGGTDELKISWARALVRRLWRHGGSLYHRIRLLPTPLNDRRLMLLFRQADMVLDSFPVGSPVNFLALALSVGTPVVTLRSGTVVSSPPGDLLETKQMLKSRSQEDLRVRQHPLFQHLLNSSASPGWTDLPWLPSASNVAGFYKRVGLDSSLVASSASHYFSLASSLAVDRELAYRLRVAILDAIDAECTASSSEAGAGVGGLWSFLREVGAPWAMIRQEFQEQARYRRAEAPRSPPSSSLRRRRTASSTQDGFQTSGASKKEGGRRKRRKRASRTAAVYDYEFHSEGGDIVTE